MLLAVKFYQAIPLMTKASEDRCLLDAPHLHTNEPRRTVAPNC